MQTIHTGFAWFDKLIPNGFPTRTSTLIGGPGGSGKPLVGDTIVSAWLRQGGSVVFMSLQYPRRDFIFASLKAVAQLDLADYAEHTAFIELDARIEGMETPVGNGFKANLVKPHIWGKAIEQACAMLPDEGPGVLVFGSALNLLLFSPTYSAETLEEIRRTLAEDKRRTYIFSVSDKPKAKEISRLEEAADNVMISHKAQDAFILFMSIKRMKGVPFVSDEVEVPIPPEALQEMKEIAHHSRQRVIPLISKI
ncbi:MAG TPA: hypothetical protein G4N96_05220 [Chloroflexi bacterium]|nr:MAG: hypothetical protein B6243_08165 [Anaerolineaceae bacterium 4572_5.2]HEY84499.1 hypothetical protein [Chloroflexota bacterium]